jgi:uncharacterized RDD family membrane protein YckC
MTNTSTVPAWASSQSVSRLAFPKADFRSRFLAGGADALLSIAVIQGLRLLSVTLAFWGCVVGMTLVFAVLTAWQGGSPGKLLFGLRVYGVDSGRRATVGQAGRREFSRLLMVLIPPLAIADVVVALGDERGRALHDRAGSTVVLRTAPTAASPDHQSSAM